MTSNRINPRLSLVKVQTQQKENPLKLFYSGIKSEETKNGYRKTLREFIFSIEELEGKFEDRAVQFAEFGTQNPEKLKQILKNYAMFLKQRSEKPIENVEYLNPSTIPNKFKGIKKFLKMNEIPVGWANIEAIFPEITNLESTRGYTTEEIRKILDYSRDVTTDFLILAESSSGMRVGGWETQVWGNIRPLYEIKSGEYTHDKNKAGEHARIVCASMVVYDGTSSKYLGLISLEAWDKLQALKEQWTRRVGREPKPTDSIILARYSDNRSYAKSGIRNKINKLVAKSGVQKIRKGRNYDVPSTHGMRKRWNKIMAEQKINEGSQANMIRKERLFGHRTGITKLDNSYFYSGIEEAVSQYLRAMPELMISEDYRTRQDLQEVQEENQKLQKTIKEKDQALVMLEELEAKVERLEKYEKRN